jgi:toxin-antitoxin system PIN domain toxin
VIAVDTNLLVYAHRHDSPWHSAASDLIASLAEGKTSWAVAWPSIHEFLAVVSHPRIFTPPTPLARALDQVDAWLESPSIHLLSEHSGYWNSFKPLVTAAKIAGPQVHDARIAALCLQHGVTELWTADRDFSRFSSLRVRNPLL